MPEALDVEALDVLRAMIDRQEADVLGAASGEQVHEEHRRGRMITTWSEFMPDLSPSTSPHWPTVPSGSPDQADTNRRMSKQ